jgi:predicted phosphohydrolase
MSRLLRVFAIADLHLSGFSPKPMDIFGYQWHDHARKLREYWQQDVAPGDIVLIPGDISWAMTLHEARVDLEWIGALPGRKVLLRGNHDYWWGAIGRVRAALPEGTEALQNDSVAYGGLLIAGTRGWTCPGSSSYEPGDERIYLRESERLALSLRHAQRLRKPGQRLIGIMHYPPFNEKREPSLFTDAWEQAGAELVVYGHLHGVSADMVFEGTMRSVEYRMVASDYIGFKPRLLLEMEREDP